MKVSVQQPVTETVEREYSTRWLRFYFTQPRPDSIPNTTREECELRAAFEDAPDALQFAKLHCIAGGFMDPRPAPTTQVLDARTGKVTTGAGAVHYLKRICKGDID